MYCMKSYNIRILIALIQISYEPLHSCFHQDLKFLEIIILIYELCSNKQ